MLHRDALSRAAEAACAARWFDPFGHSAERRTERRLIADYERVIEELLAGLSPENYGSRSRSRGSRSRSAATATSSSAICEAARRREAELLAAFRAPASGLTAAA